MGRTQSNGFIERFHGTALGRVLRGKWPTIRRELVVEMQPDLDAYVEIYNRNRPHAAAA